jgi:hypothetical protein
MKFLDYLKGVSMKDTISNIGAAMGLAGSLMLINIQSGLLPNKYEKQAQGLIGMSVVIIGFATGKSSDLKSKQSDKSE